MNKPLLIIDEPFKTLWSARDPFVAVETLKGEVFRELEARRTLRSEVGGRGYFVKIHRGVGWAEILKNLLSLRLPVLGAHNEWLALQRLTGLGVDTMHSVAFGQRGSNPATRHSFIVTEELAPTISLEDFCREWPSDPPPPAFKRALIERVADMAGRMHRGGVNHRDLYLCHFLLHLDPAPTAGDLRLSIIDLHRAQVREKLPSRWRDKDLSSLFFSALNIGLTRRDVLRFLRVYFGRSLRDILNREAVLLGYLEREAERLQAKFLR
ncbi:MAG: lipopolysaccharide core heptose(I) kinase RfaP, partial [Propionivibrio sp.]|uniref:lipopolysaccharide core heptose(I) kinase RfaP n=1 Tax=Propionivibrio sp. TaxID=2212460 RepID=UPI001A48894E